MIGDPQDATGTPPPPPGAIPYNPPPPPPGAQVYTGTGAPPSAAGATGSPGGPGGPAPPAGAIPYNPPTIQPIQPTQTITKTAAPPATPPTWDTRLNDWLEKQATESPYLDDAMGVGVAREFIGQFGNIAQMLSNIPGVELGMSEARKKQVQGYFDAMHRLSQPQGAREEAGADLAGIAEWVSGEEALKALSYVDKVKEVVPFLKFLEKSPATKAALHNGIIMSTMVAAQRALQTGSWGQTALGVPEGAALGSLFGYTGTRLAEGAQMLGPLAKGHRVLERSAADVLMRNLAEINASRTPEAAAPGARPRTVTEVEPGTYQTGRAPFPLGGQEETPPLATPPKPTFIIRGAPGGEGQVVHLTDYDIEQAARKMAEDPYLFRFRGTPPTAPTSTTIPVDTGNFKFHVEGPINTGTRYVTEVGAGPKRESPPPFTMEMKPEDVQAEVDRLTETIKSKDYQNLNLDEKRRIRLQRADYQRQLANYYTHQAGRPTLTVQTSPGSQGGGIQTTAALQDALTREQGFIAALNDPSFAELSSTEQADIRNGLADTRQQLAQFWEHQRNIGLGIAGRGTTGEAAAPGPDIYTDDPGRISFEIARLNNFINSEDFAKETPQRQDEVRAIRKDYQRQLAQYQRDMAAWRGQLPNFRQVALMPREWEGLSPAEIGQRSAQQSKLLIKSAASLTEVRARLNPLAQEVYGSLNELTGNEFTARRNAMQAAQDAYFAAAPEDLPGAKAEWDRRETEYMAMFRELHGAVTPSEAQGAAQIVKNDDILRAMQNAVDGSIKGDPETPSTVKVDRGARGLRPERGPIKKFLLGDRTYRGIDGAGMENNLRKVEAMYGRPAIDNVLGKGVLSDYYKVARMNTGGEGLDTVMRHIVNHMTHGAAVRVGLIPAGTIAAGGALIAGRPKVAAGIASVTLTVALAHNFMQAMVTNPEFAKNVAWAINKGVNPKVYGPILGRLFSAWVESRAPEPEQQAPATTATRPVPTWRQ